MKIILSRKGFDSGFGGYPSPIFPDNTFCSLPIPPSNDSYSLNFSDIHINNKNLGDMVCDLSKGKIPTYKGTHLDPDMQKDAVPRRSGWLPAFGQVRAAQGHLANHSVIIKI